MLFSHQLLMPLTLDTVDMDLTLNRVFRMTAQISMEILDAHLVNKPDIQMSGPKEASKLILRMVQMLIFTDHNMKVLEDSCATMTSSTVLIENLLLLPPSAESMIVLPKWNITSTTKDSNQMLHTLLTAVLLTLYLSLLKLLMEMAKNSLSLKKHKILFGKVLKSTNQTTTKMVRKVPSLKCSVGHTLISLKNALSLVKQDTWVSKFSHHKNLFSQMNGLNKVSLTHGGSCINQLPTNSTEEMEIEKP